MTVQEWSNDIASLAVDALIDAHLVIEEHRLNAEEVVAEEILVRLAMKDYPPHEA